MTNQNQDSGETDLVIGETVVIEDPDPSDIPQRIPGRDPRSERERFEEQFGRERDRDEPRFTTRTRVGPTKAAPGLAFPPIEPPAPGVMPDEPSPPFDIEQPTVRKPGLTPGETEIVTSTSDSLSQNLAGIGFDVPQPQAEQIATELEGLEAFAKLDEPGKGTLFGDVIRTLFSFGTIPTRNDAGDLRLLKQQYAGLQGEARDTYEQARAEAARDGATLSETEGEFLARAVPFSEDEYVEAVFQATPTALNVLKEFTINAVPIWGTKRTWADSPDWARAVSLASDVAFIVPFVGFWAAGARGGATVGGSFGTTSLATIKGPVQLITRPIGTFRSTRALRQAFESALQRKNATVNANIERGLTNEQAASVIGISSEELAASGTLTRALEIAALEEIGISVSDLARSLGNVDNAIANASTRGQATQAAGIEFIEGGKRATQGFIDPFELLLDPKRVPVSAVEVQPSTVRSVAVSGMASKEAGDIATLSLMRGEAGTAVDAGTLIELTKSPANEVSQFVAFHATPDIRFALGGFTAEGIEGGMFLSPGAHTRFTTSSAFGSTGGKGAMPGLLMITDSEIHAKLISSNKLFRGMVEMEAVIPDGTPVGLPSQFLRMRDQTGQVLTIAVFGPTLNAAQVAKLKILGTGNTITNAFRGGIKFRNADEAVKAAKAYDEMVGLADEAADISQQATIVRNEASTAAQTGNVSLADELGREANRLEANARRVRADADAASERLGLIMAPNAAWSPGALYYGDQDIEQALNILGEESLAGTRDRAKADPSELRAIEAGTIRAPEVPPHTRPLRGAPPEISEAFPATRRDDRRPSDVATPLILPGVAGLEPTREDRRPEEARTDRPVILPEIRADIRPDERAPREDDRMPDEIIPRPDERVDDERVDAPEPERPDLPRDDDRIPGDPDEPRIDRPPDPDDPRIVDRPDPRDDPRLDPRPEPRIEPRVEDREPPRITPDPSVRAPRIEEEPSRARLPEFGPGEDDKGRDLSGLIPVAWKQHGRWILVLPPYEIANFQFPALAPTGARFHRDSIEALAFVDTLVDLSPRAREFWVSFATLTSEEAVINVKDRKDELSGIVAEETIVRNEVDTERAPANSEKVQLRTQVAALRLPIDTEQGKLRAELQESRIDINKEQEELRASIEEELLGFGFKSKKESRPLRRPQVSFGRARQRPVVATATEVDFTDEKRKGGFSVRPQERN